LRCISARFTEGTTLILGVQSTQSERRGGRVRTGGVSFIADSGLEWQRLVTSRHCWRRAEGTSLAGLSPAKQLDDNLIRDGSKREHT
jgi:hypothetical protein